MSLLWNKGTGTLLLQICKTIGAGPLFIAGLNRDEMFRLVIAKKLGADYIVNIEKEDIRRRIAELTGELGVDVVLENTGSVDSIDQSLDIVRKGGKVLWAGGGIRGGVIAPINTYKIIVKEIDIKGEISQIPYDWFTAIYLAQTNRLKLEQLVTHIYSLDDWEEAFSTAATSSKCLRVALKP